MSLMRTRWAAIGAAVAVTLGTGGIGITQATTGSGERPIYLPIEPCRLASTRPAPDTVGPRTTGLGPSETYTLGAWGAVGNCDLPTGTSGLALNVTAVGATEQTNLRFFPAGAAVPTAANLNPSPGAPPTPNAVNVGLNGSGEFSVFNRFGTVAVVIDVVGLYDDHHHDDRYYRKDQLYTRAQVDAAIAAGVPASEIYTKAEIDAALGLKADSADVYTQAQVDAAILALRNELTAVQTKRATINETAFVARDPNDLVRRGFGTGGAYLSTVSGSDDGLMASIQLPDGARIVTFTAHSFDDTNIGGENLTIRLQRLFHGSGSYGTVATVSTFAGGGVVADSIGLSHVVDNDTASYHIFVTGAIADNRRIRTIEITYEIALP